MSADLRSFMRLAVDKARQSPPDNRVGVVLVRDGVAMTTGYKGEDGSRKHAEAVALDKAAAQDIDLTGTTAFVTLEPCSNLESKRTCCADLLADAGVTTVYIGRYDRNPRINQQGWKALRDRGVRCYDFDDDFRDELDVVDNVFPGHFQRRTGQTGTARFDPTQNGGRYELALREDLPAIAWTTRWGTKGRTSVYAIGGTPGTVALARYRRTFDEVDKPDAYDYEGHFAALDLGDIAIFRNNHGHALVKLRTVEPPPPYGNTPHVSLTFDYELRPYDATVLIGDGNVPG